MADGDRLVPRDSALYREFARLHQMAHEARSTGVNRWSGDLYATSDGLWGGFDPKTGSIRLSQDLVLRHLTGKSADREQGKQAEALATVLHESTHSAMETDAPGQPNAVRSQHSKGIMEGVAELRTTTDFDAFADAAGYTGIALPGPQYPGPHAAVDNLITQAAGPVVSRQALIDKMAQGPGVMHFDQLADGVLRNRLAHVVPNRVDDQLAVRAALIQTMMHPHWPTLPHRSADAGELVAKDIRPGLNAKVDEIRHHYQVKPQQPFPADSPNQYAVRLAAEDSTRAEQSTAPSEPDPRQVTTSRFLTGQAPAAHATRPSPYLGNGARGAGIPAGRSIDRPTRTNTPDRGRD
ncbi:hypothetical protein F1D05_06225 [Kribbella qitaiheensis]|uniref:Uncharacterized protein n=1 Tax=Kribbella qitaiheensis TaxID=1544730 RepID=A0A7G6WUB2_9ACTN|nr:hypothetical protein [Kribbella qitaiheensis]QNE17577.1 hypothetical protein F1D05_06225 [Kribbella qitaiheensis]